jgi:hypothetical protein
MIDLIEFHRKQINEICRRYRVERLELFGSAASGKFDKASSDLDFIVQFTDADTPGIARRYFGLAEDLEQLFDRSVDLLTDRPFQNPYFAQAVAETREILYENRNEKAAL